MLFPLFSVSYFLSSLSVSISMSLSLMSFCPYHLSVYLSIYLLYTILLLNVWCPGDLNYECTISFGPNMSRIIIIRNYIEGIFLIACLTFDNFIIKVINKDFLLCSIYFYFDSYICHS